MKTKTIIAGSVAAALISIAALTFILNNQENGAGRSLTLSVDGMHCAGCVVAAQKAIKQVPGVNGIKIDAFTSKATVIVDTSFTDTGSLIKALKRAGLSGRIN